MINSFTLIVLPLKINKSTFYEVINLINSRWLHESILLYLLCEEEVDLLGQFPSIKGESRFLTNDVKINLEKKYGRLARVVILQDNEDNNPDFEWEQDIGIPVYRNALQGEGGIRIVGDITKDAYSFMGKHIFIKHIKKNGFNYFPYGYISCWPNFDDINELGFRCEHDFNKHKKRNKNCKLVIIFGNSGAFDVNASPSKMFSKILEQRLNTLNNKRYIVLNFAKPASVTIDSIVDYTIFASDLKPDFVIFYGAYNDCVYGQITDPLLLSKHNITYFYDFEKNAESAQAEYIDSFLNINLSSTVTNVFIERLFQFKTICENDGATFIFVLQPFLQSKKALSLRESKRYEEVIAKELFHGAFKYEAIRLLYSNIKQRLTDKQLLFLDLDDKFYIFGVEDDIFADHIHHRANINNFIADNIFTFMNVNFFESQ